MSALGAAEQELQAFRTMTRDLPGLFASTCPITKTIVACNQALVETLGHSSPADLLGSPIQDIYDWSCQELFNHYYGLWLTNGSFEGLGLSLKTRRGSKIPIFVQVDSIRDQCQAIRYSKVNYTPLNVQQFAPSTLNDYQSIISQDNRDFEKLNTLNQLFKQNLGLCSLYAEILKKTVDEDSLSLDTLTKTSEKLVRATSDLKLNLAELVKNKKTD